MSKLSNTTLVFGQQLMMKLKTNAIIVRFMIYIQVQCIYKQTFRAPNSSPFSMQVTREEIVK